MTNEELLALYAEVAANPHLTSARMAGLEGLDTICNEVNKDRPKDKQVTEDDVIASVRAAKAARAAAAASPEAAP